MNNLIVKEVKDNEWDKYVSNHPNGFHEQSSGFGQQRKNNNYNYYCIGIYENKILIGGAMILYVHIPIIGKVATISQGPLVDSQRLDIATELFKGIHDLSRKLKIRKVKVISYINNEFWYKVLKDFGYTVCQYRWSAQKTIQVPISEEDDVILANMKSGCRYNVRFSQRKNVVVRNGDEADIKIFYKHYLLTAKRNNFPTLPITYFLYVWRLFAPQNKLRLFIAFINDEPLSSIIVSVMRNRAFYTWGAMSDYNQHLKANYLLHWNAIKWARSVGCDIYDLNNIDGGGGVSDFKKQWGGIETQFPDPVENYFGMFKQLYKKCSDLAWDYPMMRQFTKSLKYRLYGRIPF